MKLKQAASKFYNDNRAYHDSDGVDAAECFQAGAHFERARILEFLRVDNPHKQSDMADWLEEKLLKEEEK